MPYYPQSSFMHMELFAPEIVAGMLNNTTQSISDHYGVTTSGKLSIVDVAARESGKTYAMWNGKAVEITDDLLSIFICPSDMNGVPCEHDEIHGCRKIRLCKLLERFTNWRCPITSNDGINGGVSGQPCPHIHEVDMSCRYISQLHVKPERICKQVEDKRWPCSHAHDHQTARQHAFDGYWVHLREARARGSRGSVHFPKTW